MLLDPEDRRISRRHLLLWRQDGDFLVRDESPTGTFLNGQRFESHRLVVGDRFQMGGYSFEFTGISLRRTRPRIGGKVEALGVGFRAGGRTILSDVTLHIEQCSFSGILGGSGQGKSTLLNALCGINPATTGTVLIEGRSIGDSAGMDVAGIGFVPQDDIVHPELRVEEAVLFSARLRLDPRVPFRPMRLLVDETIQRLGLGEHRHKRIFQLSGGQRKRVSIATELLDKPAVLFLDEPSSGLDPATEFALMKILRGLAAHDCTVICTTHVLGRAYLFDKIIFIHGGRVIFDGAPDQAYEHFQVESLDQVYVRLAEEGRTGDEWAGDFKSTEPERQSADLVLRATGTLPGRGHSSGGPVASRVSPFAEDLDRAAMEHSGGGQIECAFPGRPAGPYRHPRRVGGRGLCAANVFVRRGDSMVWMQQRSAADHQGVADLSSRADLRPGTERLPLQQISLPGCDHRVPGPPPADHCANRVACRSAGEGHSGRALRRISVLNRFKKRGSLALG